jgi:hypothetical protein
MKIVTRNNKKKIYVDLGRNLDYDSDFCDSIPIEYSDDEEEEDSGYESDRVVKEKKSKKS